MFGLKIRKAELDDLDEIAKLLLDLIESMENIEGINPEKLAGNCGRLLKNDNSFLLVAEHEQYIVGFLNFTIRWTALADRPSGLIDELVVAKEYRGKGIGQMLVKAAEEKCRQLKCSEIEVATEKSNLAARQFYIQCGYDEDAVLFEKHFGE